MICWSLVSEKKRWNEFKTTSSPNGYIDKLGNGVQNIYMAWRSFYVLVLLCVVTIKGVNPPKFYEREQIYSSCFPQLTPMTDLLFFF